MPNRGRSLGICFLILPILYVCGSTALFYDNNAYAQIGSKTLESVAVPTGISEGVAQINTGDSPQYIYGDPSSSAIYVANFYSNTVSVINTTDNTVIQNIPVGEGPEYISGDPSSSAIYVANFYSNTVSVINTTDNTVIQNIPVGEGPESIYSDPRSGTLYVANGVSGTVSVIRETDGEYKKLRDITAGQYPNSIDGDPNSGSGYIYVANYDGGIVTVINPRNNTRVYSIPVGDGPEYTFADPLSGYVFVPNAISGTVSVIDSTLDSVMNEIPVGKYPISIYRPTFDNLPALWDRNDVYVANYESNTVSVIDAFDHTIIKNVSVGEGPQYIYGDPSSSAIYVANYDSNTVSVISGENYTKIKDIAVGKNPSMIYGNLSSSEAIYVANSGSDGISVINNMTNEVVAGVTFDVSPFKAGEITCKTNIGDLDAPTNRFMYVSSGIKCIAKPNKGFEFSSWGEALEGNSSRTIIASSGSPWASLLESFNLKPDDPAAILAVNQFGNLTAYFRTLQPAIPTEYWVPLYGIIVSTVVGWSIPSILTWRKSKKQISRLNSYHKEMTSLHEDDKLDENDIDTLDILNKKIINAYSEGKINNEQFTNLKSEIAVLFEEIFRKRIDSIRELPNEDQSRSLDRIKDDIRDAYSKGKISELHFKLLNERIANMTV
jgi:YVTN family beta-propeller protein